MLFKPKQFLEEIIEGHPVDSLLDVDFYKFTMMYVILLFLKLGDLWVRFSFKNRSKTVKIPEIIDPRLIEAELAHVYRLRFEPAEIHYLNGTYEYGDRRMFTHEMIEFLRNFTFDDTTYKVDVDSDGKLQVIFEGPWVKVMMWETICLSIIFQLVFAHKLRQMTSYERELEITQAAMRAHEKIAVIKQHPEMIISEMGTRRRPARLWQEYLLYLLMEIGPSLQGTSNTLLALKTGQLPMGTSAHELVMVLAAYLGAMEGDSGILRANDEIVRVWWEAYGPALSIFLPDTYGSEQFFSRRTEQELRDWKGSRQDSGDAFAYGENRIKMYERFEIDPTRKLSIFSDGLNIHTMVQLLERFQGRIIPPYGWGTNWGNDFPNIPAFSAVVKASHVRVNGVWVPTVKLSDNLAKAFGPAEEIERYKRVFGYTVDYAEECTV